MNDTIRIPTMEKIRANCEQKPVHSPYTRLFQEPGEDEQPKQILNIEDMKENHVAPVVARNITKEIEEIYRRLANKAPRAPKNVTLVDMLALQRAKTKQRKKNKHP